MKLFIFGAGASKGSQNEERNPLEPSDVSPLVDELFLGCYSRHNHGNPNDPNSHGFLSPHEWAECVENASRGKSLEQWLSRRWSAIESVAQEPNRFAEKAFFAKITFYIRTLFQGISNTYGTNSGYAVLLRKLRRNDEPFGMISFNYDTLLDRAIQDVYGYDMSSFQDNARINLVKPHGSVNWIIPCRGEETGYRQEGFFDVGTRIDAAIAKMYNGPSFNIQNAIVYNPRHKDLDLLDALVEANNKRHFYPFVFIPLTTKLYATVEKFSEGAIQNGKSLVDKAQEIFLVGYRAQDEIIAEMFREVARPSEIRLRTKLHVVGLDDSEQVMTDALKLSENLERGNIYGTGFMTFAESYQR